MVRLDKLTRSQTSSRRRDLVPPLLDGLCPCFCIQHDQLPAGCLPGGLTGLKTWWNIVFPALLPFFIASELLMSFGVVHFMGVLLEPVMRPPL